MEIVPKLTPRQISLILKPISIYKVLSEKAGILFEEMGLERDLDDLERVKADYGL